MLKFRKSKVLLLKELRELVTTGLEHSEDRRLSRKLKFMRKEVDKWISELKDVENKDTHVVISSPKS
jgi:hypothetical protein